MGDKVLVGLFYFVVFFFVLVGLSFVFGGSTFSGEESFSDSVAFRFDDCYLGYTPIDGSTQGSVSIDDSGTTGINAPPIYRDSKSHDEFYPGACMYPDRTCYSPNISDRREWGSSKTQVMYGGATGFQNAYAVAVVSTNSKENITAKNGGETINGIAGFHKYASDSVGVDIYGATIGSGISGMFSADGGGTFPTSGTTITHYEKGFSWGTGSSSKVNTLGPAAFALTAAWTSGGVSSGYTDRGGVGTSTITQNPLYPIALLFCDGQFMQQIEPICGQTAYYKSASGGEKAGSLSTAKVSSAIGYTEPLCYPTRITHQTGSQDDDSIPASMIGHRSLSCKNIPLELQNSLGLSSDSCPVQSDPPMATTAEAIKSRNETIDYYFNFPGSTTNNCVVKTYVAKEAAPDTFEWLPQDNSGYQFWSIVGWASKAYATYEQSASCNSEIYAKPHAKPNNYPYCVLEDATPNPQDVGKDVVWKANVFVAADYGWGVTSIPFFGKTDIDWEGSDNIKQTGPNPLIHKYSGPGQHYMNATAKIMYGGKSVTLLCAPKTTSIQPNLEVKCSGTPAKQLNGNPATVTWGVYPSGGTASSLEDYKVEWVSLSNPSNEARIDKTAKTVKAEYVVEGKKTASVKVTDSSVPAKSQTASCEVEIEPFEVSCKADKTIAFINEIVTWSSTVYPEDVKPGYSWSGTDFLSGNQAMVSKSYAIEGDKIATVKVTAKGTQKTASCGPVKIIVEPLMPSCVVSTPNNLAVDGSIDVTVTAFKFANPVSSVTANCGVSATPMGEAACNGLTDKASCMFSCKNYASGNPIMVTLSNGADTAVCSTTTNANQNMPPTCDFTKPAPNSQFSLGPGNTVDVLFGAMATDPDGDTITGSINYGDNYSDTWNNLSANETTRTHAYAKSGNYPVTLNISDGQGGTNTCRTSVQINSGGGEQGGDYTCEFTSPKDIESRLRPGTTFPPSFREGVEVPFEAKVTNVQSGNSVSNLSAIFSDWKLEYDIGVPKKDTAEVSKWNLSQSTGKHKYYLQPTEIENMVEYTARQTLKPKNGKPDVSCDKKVRIVKDQPPIPICIVNPVSATIDPITNSKTFELKFDGLRANVNSIQLKCTDVTDASAATSIYDTANCNEKDSTLDDDSCTITCGNYSGSGVLGRQNVTHNVTADLIAADGITTLETCKATVITNDSTVVSPTGDLVSISIAPIPSTENVYVKNGLDDLDLEVIVAKLDKDVSSATFQVLREKAGDAPKIISNSQRVSFVGAPTTSRQIIYDREVRGLDTGTYIYAASITNIVWNGDPDADDPNPGNNRDDTVILLTDNVTVVPELPILFVTIMALAIIAIMKRS